MTENQLHSSAAATAETQNANSDPREVQKFADMSHEWWDVNGSLKTLHAINPLRMQWIQGISPLADRQVLDVGCGGGILAEALAREAKEVKGIDLAEKSIRIARLHAMESGIENLSYEVIPVETLAQHTPAAYDVVTCMEMLEHVPNPASAVAAVATLLKPGGWAFFSTINRHPVAWLTSIVAAEYIMGMVPKGTHHYNRFITPAELARTARRYQLAPLHAGGLRYNPFTGRFALHSDTTVNYFLACRKQQQSD